MPRSHVCRPCPRVQGGTAAYDIRNIFDFAQPFIGQAVFLKYNSIVLNSRVDCIRDRFRLPMISFSMKCW